MKTIKNITSKYICIALVLTTTSCNNDIDGNRITKQYLDIELPNQAKLQSYNSSSAIGDFYQNFTWTFTDKQCEMLTKEIRKSKYFVDTLYQSRPHDTTYHYWYHDKDKYFFITDNGNPFVNAMLDLTNNSLSLSIADD